MTDSNVPGSIGAGPAPGVSVLSASAVGNRVDEPQAVAAAPVGYKVAGLSGSASVFTGLLIWYINSKLPAPLPDADSQMLIGAAMSIVGAITAHFAHKSGVATAVAAATN